MTEGVDYSRTANADWGALAAALKAEGKHFAGRYAVNDKAPGGRGITSDEYHALMTAGVDVFLYWQTTTNWMLGGYAAGVVGAVNAQQNIVAAGMPPNIPVYFACDFDADLGDQAIIDDCLRGCASVLGKERVGLYAGRWPLTRAMQNKTATWFCQTSAWSGGVVVDGIHLYQYGYNQWYGGTNCDHVRAYQDNYGQVSKFIGPVYETPAPISWQPGIDTGWFDLNGRPVYAMRGSDAEAKKTTVRRTHASASAPKAAPNLLAGEHAIVIGSFAIPRQVVRNGVTKTVYERWVIFEDLSRARATSLTPLFPIRP